MLCASGEMKGCRGGTSEFVSIDEADGNPGHGVEPADVRNKTDTLIVLSIESESLGSGGIPCVCLEGMRMRPGNVNGSGIRTDGPGCQADVLRGQMDAPITSNSAEMVRMSCGDEAGTYLGVRDAKLIILETVGVRDHADASIGHRDALSVEMEMIKPADKPEIIRLPRKKVKPPDLPSRSAGRHPDEPDGCGNLAEGLTVHADAQSIGDERETAQKMIVQEKAPCPS